MVPNFKVVRGPFSVARPRVVRWRGDLARPGFVWGVVFGTQHWATWSNGYQRTFKPTKLLKPRSKNHDNGRINI